MFIFYLDIDKLWFYKFLGKVVVVVRLYMGGISFKNYVLYICVKLEFYLKVNGFILIE